MRDETPGAPADNTTIGLVATAAAAVGGYSIGGFPGFLVGISFGAAAGHTTVVIMLDCRGLHCARLDLAFATVALTALSLWVLLRIKKEMRS